MSAYQFEDDDRETLTNEETQIAYAFLKKRFPEYSVPEIVSSLYLNAMKKEQERLEVARVREEKSRKAQEQLQQNELARLRQMQPSQEPAMSGIRLPAAAIPRAQMTIASDNGNSHPNRQAGRGQQEALLSSQDSWRPFRSMNLPIEPVKDTATPAKLQKFEEQRVVAKIFSEHGINYSLITYFFPNMSNKTYRAHVETVNNNTVNEIQRFLRQKWMEKKQGLFYSFIKSFNQSEFIIAPSQTQTNLRYECNVQIQRLNRDQKRSMRTQLTRVREWLGNRDSKQLETYYKFMERHYEQNQPEIQYQDSIKLYKTILQIVKSPFVDVLEQSSDGSEAEDQEEEQMDDQQQSPQYCSKEEEKAIIILYLKYKNLSKVSNALCEKYGYSLKWSKHSLRHIFRQIIKTALKKLIGSAEKYGSEKLNTAFSATDENVSILVDSEESCQVKIKLMNFHLKKKVNLNELADAVKAVNKFFLTELRQDEDEESEDLTIPKLEGESTKVEPNPKTELEVPIKLQAEPIKPIINSIEASAQRFQNPTILKTPEIPFQKNPQTSSALTDCAATPIRQTTTPVQKKMKPRKEPAKKKLVEEENSDCEVIEI